MPANVQHSDDVAPHEWKSRLLADVRERLDSIPTEDITRLGSLESLADRMVAVVPRRHPLDEQAGPFYDLGASRRCYHVRGRPSTTARAGTGC